MSKLTIVSLGAMLISLILIIVMYAIIPVIGSQIDTSVTIQDNVQATGTITFGTGPGVEGETINVSTETYTLKDTANATAAFDVDLAGGTASEISENLTAEITANSTLLTAVDGTGSVVVTSVLTGALGNAYGSTTNVTDGSWGAATLTGGINGSQWNSNVNSDMPTGHGFWTTLSSFVLLSALMLFIAGFIGALKGIRG